MYQNLKESERKQIPMNKIERERERETQEDQERERESERERDERERETGERESFTFVSVCCIINRISSSMCSLFSHKLSSSRREKQYERTGDVREKNVSPSNSISSITTRERVSERE